METNSIVRCPNLCVNGQIKQVESTRALHIFVVCPYCKGKGKVTQEEAIEIDKKL